jgi:hypothetical protein
MPTPSILLIPDRYKAAVLYSQIPDSGAVDFGVTRSTTAYRTNASGLLESVASGVPRLDYPIGGGCPSLLVEPAATNLVLRSEEFDDAYWTKTRSTISANASTAPNGTTTADKLIPSNENATHFVGTTLISFTSGTTYTWSVFAKKDGYDHFRLAFGLNAFSLTGRGASFNLNTGATGQTESGVTSRIQDVGNGYYRCSITATAIATVSDASFFNSQNADSATTVTFAGDGTSGAFIWGAQLETGSVATSYIPTVAATATRNADVISKTGVSGFIGQAEGTIYAEVDISQLLGAAARTIFAIETGTSRVQLFFTGLSANTIRAIVRETNLTKYDARTTITTTGIIKLAIAYKSLDTAFYVNGVEITNVLTNLSFGSINFSDALLGSADTNFLNDRIRAAAVYTTRLSNAELAALTTL